MRLVLCAVDLFIGALLFALPNMTRREVLFAVPVPADFRESRAGHHAIRMFRALVLAVVLAGVGALLLSPAGLLNATATAVPFASLLAATIGFVWQHRSLAPAAVQFTRSREAELTTAPDALPRYTPLAAGPLVILAAAALCLSLNWDRIPARFPVHWNLVGQADRWAERSVKGVYGSLFLAAEFCAWLLMVMALGWFGARRSRFRRVMFGGLIAVQNSLALVFALIALQPVLGIPVWAVVLAPIVILLPTIAVLVRKLSAPSEPMDPTPNECWKGGVIYYDPNDAALFVEKRLGLGYTLNFANRWLWVLVASLALVIASAPFVMP
jgi:uncharacterized membrane protein